MSVTAQAPKGSSVHGYFEFWVTVVNRSPTAGHTVRVSFPRSSYTPGTDHLQSAERTVVVEPGQTARVAVLYPEKISVNGNGLGVTVDGREQEEMVPLAAPTRTSSGGYSSYSSARPPEPTVLFGRDLPTRFPDWVREAESKLPGAPPLAPLSPLGVTVTYSPAAPPLCATECVRSESPAAEWSPHWLGYGRYDAVATTANDWKAFPPPVAAALAHYAECGGTLLVFGAGAPLPAGWKPAGGAVGFGRCVVLAADVNRPFAGDAEALLRPWMDSYTQWKRNPSVGESNAAFPVVEDVQAPTTWLLVLMAGFCVVIGPVNLFVLARMKRKLWLFWTVPAFALLTSLAVFSTMAVVEGWGATTRVESVTILDQSTKRAATVGVVAVYAPVVPSSGLLFDTETELSYQNGVDASVPYYMRQRDAGAALTIDWTRGQHLASGWLAPRAPAHFLARKGEARRERLTIEPGPSGPEAVNALGADAVKLWYRDAKGELFFAENVAAGARAKLGKWYPDPETAKNALVSPKTPHDLFRSEWYQALAKLEAGGPTLATPNTYFAVLDGAPFLADGLAKAKQRRARSAVLGRLGGAGDAR